MAETILVVDDDEKLLDLVSMALRPQGFAVFTAESGKGGLKTYHQIAPDLVILDIMMPDMDGWEVCSRLRETSAVPIIFLTALDSVDDTVEGLRQGADDYLTKPFRISELEARVHAVLRRARMSHKEPDTLRFGDNALVINRTEKRVFAQDQEVSLSPTEYNLLIFLAERAGRILPTEIIFDAVWGSTPDADMDSVKWYIWRLRQKIEEEPGDPRFILTERGKGYRFSPH